MSSIIMKEIFSFGGNNNYNLRSSTHLSRPILHTTYYGTEFTKYLGAEIWELISQKIKEANCMSSFKNKVKKWIPKN